MGIEKLPQQPQEAEKINPREAERELTSKVNEMERLKDEINDKQLEDLEAIIHAEMTSGNDLESIYKIIHMNPNMSEDDKNKYMTLWEEKCEPNLIKAYERNFATVQLDFIEDIQKSVKKFPFTNEQIRDALLEVADDRLVELYEEVIDSYDDADTGRLQGAKQVIEDSDRFKDTEKQKKLLNSVEVKISQSNK